MDLPKVFRKTSKNRVYRALRFNCLFLGQSYYKNINPIQDEWGKKPSLPSFSPLPSSNVRVSPQNFLTFSFKPFWYNCVKF